MRIPAVFTAMADVFAGYFVVASGHTQWSELTWLLLSSSMIYTSGMVLNDYFDYQVDLRERPQRPLPSGRIARRSAFTLGLMLMVAGALSALMVRSHSFLLSLLLIMLVLSYDSLTKQIPWVGTINMGACRFVNILLGASLIPLRSDARYIVAALMMIYVMSIMPLSKIEVQGGWKREIPLSLLGLIIVISGTILLKILGVFHHHALFFFLLLFSLVALSFVPRLLRQPTPEVVQGAIKRLLLGIVLLDATFISGSAGIVYGLLVLCLLIPSILLARIIYVT